MAKKKSSPKGREAQNEEFMALLIGVVSMATSLTIMLRAGALF